MSVASDIRRGTGDTTGAGQQSSWRSVVINPLLQSRPDGAVSCAEGWAVRFLAPDLLEYSHGQAACLVNVGAATSGRGRSIYASESSSALFPKLREHLESALGHFKGQYVVV